ncbi:RNA polymerase sigma factor [Tardiphaga alba]|uniref:RNA polymerase sigma factor n=1 Tax=Tardiphaga alba TaxID=340268 RepID=UPI002011F7A0|nr:sigma-70 family RNA polymerase sigma factor [Tardiphaga alba]
MRDVLAADYTGLFKRLTRRLGNSELAGEALQDTFLRVERMTNATAISSPKDYLFRMALNVATDRRRVEQRHLSLDAVDALLDVPDDSPDASAIVEGRQDIQALDRALAELPARARQVFVLAVIKKMADQQIAAQLGVSLRTVEIDLRNALKHCAQRLDRTLIRRTGGPRPR